MYPSGLPDQPTNTCKRVSIVGDVGGKAYWPQWLKVVYIFLGK
jgi:hypothetical protein